MGQKVSPHGLRVGIIKDWDSKWYASSKNFADYLVEDNKIRTFVKKRLYAAGVSRVLIERAANNQMRVIILVGKPGMVIGRDGSGQEQLKKELEKMTGKTCFIEIVEVRKTELDAQLTAESIASALEKRISFRRAMKQAIGRTMKSGAKGVKVLVSGRLGGAEIARSEKYSEGNVPLHTLRANIDYGFAEADTTYGKLGVKVWINHGEILDKGLQSARPEEKPAGRRDGDRKPRRDNDRNNRRNKRDGDNRGRRDDRFAKPELAPAVNPRVRKAPKATEAPAPAPAPEQEIVKEGGEE
ncbi:MAG TPA: 30S ribosomal protein S3 [Bacillota bacterium]|nr:30S ribosomal protein S3 [Bacillota bacterium]